MKNAVLILSIATSSLLLSVDLKARFNISPEDYSPNGVMASTAAPLVDLKCFQNPTQMGREELKSCLVTLRSAALKTYGLQAQHLEASRNDLYRLFSHTTAPSNWDVHAPLLYVMLDRLKALDNASSRLKRETINPGLWLSLSTQANFLSRFLLSTSKGANTTAVNVINDLIVAGETFQREIVFTDSRGRPDGDRLGQLASDARAMATEMVHRAATHYVSQITGINGHDFMTKLDEIPAGNLGKSLNVESFGKCSNARLVTDNLDMNPPILWYSYREGPNDHSLFQSAIRRYAGRTFLAAEDILFKEANFDICYDDRGWLTERRVRLSGDDRENHEALMGRFYVTFRGSLSGQIAFRVKVISNESVEHHVHYRKFDSNGKIETQWIDYIGGRQARENRVLSRLWSSHELIDKFMAGDASGTLNDFQREEVERNSAELFKSITNLRDQKKQELEQFLSTLHHSDTLAAEWEGALRAFRSYAILIAPETFATDQSFFSAITLKDKKDGAGNWRIVDRSSLNAALTEDGTVLSQIVHGDPLPLNRTVFEIQEALKNRLAPEISPQRLRVISQMIETLATTRDEIKAQTPKVAIEEALTSLRQEIKKFASGND